MKNRFSDLNHAEMLAKRDELKERQRKLNFDRVMGHIDNRMEIRVTRRSIARLNTFISQAERLQGAESSSPSLKRESVALEPSRVTEGAAEADKPTVEEQSEKEPESVG